MATEKQDIGANAALDPKAIAKAIVGSLKMSDQERENADAIADFLMAGGTIGDLNNFAPEDYEVMYTVAHSFYEGGKYADAALIFQYLCINDPLTPRWWMGMGAAMQKQARYPEAVNAYAHAMALDIDDPRPSLQGGYCLMMMGDQEKAKAALEQCVLTSKRKKEHAGYGKQAGILLENMDSAASGAATGKGVRS